MVINNGHNHDGFARGGTHTLVDAAHAVTELQVHTFNIKQTRFGDGFNIQDGGLL